MTTLMERFKNTFIYESPRQISTGQLSTVINDLRDVINTHISDNTPVWQANKNTFKISTAHNLYYWNINENNEIILAAQINKDPDMSAIVTMLGKDQRYIGKSPYASTLYELIVKDLGKSVTFKSDETLTADAFANWSRLLEKGYKILVFDQNMPGKSCKILKTIDNMKEFYKDDDEFRRYQFVLSENARHALAVYDGFALYRMRELSGQTDRNS